MLNVFAYTLGLSRNPPDNLRNILCYNHPLAHRSNHHQIPPLIFPGMVSCMAAKQTTSCTSNIVLHSVKNDVRLTKSLLCEIRFHLMPTSPLASSQLSRNLPQTSLSTNSAHHSIISQTLCERLKQYSNDVHSLRYTYCHRS